MQVHSEAVNRSSCGQPSSGTQGADPAKILALVHRDISSSATKHYQPAKTHSDPVFPSKIRHPSLDSPNILETDASLNPNY